MRKQKLRNVFISPDFHSYYQHYPIKLVDVGASGGLQSPWKDAREFLAVVGFEPDEQEFKNLTENRVSKVTYLNVALYKERISIDFHSAADHEKSSIFLPNRIFLDKFPNPKRFDIVRTVRLEVDTLDSQLDKHGIGDIDFIKLDTQGSELFILQGANRTMDHTFGLEVEVEFAQMYKGQPLFADLDKFVRSKGFHLFDLRPFYWKRTNGMSYGEIKGQLIFANALYLKDTEVFGQHLAQIEDDVVRKSKVLRAISICVLYGYFDYAAEIFELNRALFDNREIQTSF